MARKTADTHRPQPGKELEGIVRRIEETFGDDCQVKSPDWLPDRAGKRKREVDVSVRRKVGSQLMLIINECRDHKRKVGAPYVESIATKRDDVLANKAVIISSLGFSKPAIEKADHHGIGLMTLKDGIEADWRLWMAADCFEVRSLRCNRIWIKVIVERADVAMQGAAASVGDLQIEREDGSVVDNLVAVVMNAINTEPAAAELIPFGEPKPIPFNIDVSAANLRARHAGGVEDVLRLQGVGEFWFEVTAVPVQHYAYAATDGKQAAEYAEAVFDVPGAAAGLRGRVFFVRTDAGMRVMFEAVPTAAKPTKNARRTKAAKRAKSK